MREVVRRSGARTRAGAAYEERNAAASRAIGVHEVVREVVRVADKEHDLSHSATRVADSPAARHRALRSLDTLVSANSDPEVEPGAPVAAQARLTHPHRGPQASSMASLVTADQRSMP